MFQNGLFGKAINLLRIGIKLDNAKINFRSPPIHGDCGISITANMVIKQGSKINIAYNIGVHHQKIIWQVFGQRAQGACGTQRLIFSAIGNVNAELLAVAKVGFNQLRQVAHGNCNLVKAVVFQLPQY